MVEQKKNPKFSIITVVYNDVENIEETIKSVLNQTYKDFEYIIIDGKSDDGTVEKIKKHEKEIDYWVSEKDGGIYDAMNKGIRKSKGELLFFLNSNDFFYNNKVLENVSKQYFKNKEGGIFYGRVFFRFNNSLKEDGISPQRKANKTLPLGYSLYHQAAFFDKKVFEKIGVFDTRFIIAGDHDFFCRAFVNNVKFIYIDDVISVFTDGGRGSNQSLVYKENSEITKKYFGKVAFLRYILYRKTVRNLLEFVKKVLIFLGLKGLLSRLIAINNRKRTKV